MNTLHLERYSRQLPIIGEDGQRRLNAATALVVGCGGLGSALLYALAGAGVGRLRFADGDTVALSNLNRQFLHTMEDIGKNKAQSAYEKLSRFNPDIQLEPYPTYITEENAQSIMDGCDIALLAVDSRASRRVLNRGLVNAGIPFVDGGVNGFSGTVMSVLPGQSACLECLHGGPKNRETAAPALASVVTTISALEAQLGLLLLLGQQNPIPDALLLFDGAKLTLETIPLRRTPGCPVCGCRNE